jgi:aldose sugar dehydrogenase
MKIRIITVFLIMSTMLYGQQGETLYKEYCAGCHGANLQGNTASRLIKPEWQNGKSRDAILHTISMGISKTEMIGWSNVLNEKQLMTLVDFIMSSQHKTLVKSTIPDRLITNDYVLKIEKLVITNIQTPWAIEFVDNNKALITEKAGNLRWLVNDKLDAVPIQGLPQPFTKSGTAGFMDIATDPKYAANGWIYLGYSHTRRDVTDKNSPGMTRIIRGRIVDHLWRDEQTLFEVADSLLIVGGDRWGCRLLFDTKGLLYFTIGDMGKAMDSQNLSRASGKVYRINPDGTIPMDNPFINVPGALPAIFTLGNRNVQGICQHPVTGEIWATEHGPRGGDELNILRKGANYGWPVITYGIDYNGSIVSEKTEQVGMEQPIIQWTPSIAVCPAEFYNGTIFGKWKNNLLIGALAYEELHRLVIDKNKIIKKEMILKGYGRVRDIKPAPGGALYVVFNNPDMIVRITPE